MATLTRGKTYNLITKDNKEQVIFITDIQFVSVTYGIYIDYIEVYGYCQTGVFASDILGIYEVPTTEDMITNLNRHLTYKEYKKKEK